MHRPLALPVLLIALAGCAPAASTAPIASPPTGASAVPSATTGAAGSPTPSPAVPLPSAPPGTTSWPKAFDIELAGTYWSSPPFSIPFAITVEEPGWFSGHLHAEFLDLQRFDGITPHQFPNRLLGFADPDRFRGADGPVAVAGLTPGAALDLLAARASLRTTDRAAVELFGLAGERLDLHSATNNNPLFGGTEGDFGLGPELDVRLVALPRDGRLFVVVVSAPPGEIDAAWEQAMPILETIRFG